MCGTTTVLPVHELDGGWVEPGKSVVDSPLWGKREDFDSVLDWTDYSAFDDPREDTEKIAAFTPIAPNVEPQKVKVIPVDDASRADGGGGKVCAGDSHQKKEIEKP